MHVRHVLLRFTNKNATPKLWHVCSHTIKRLISLFFRKHLLLFKMSHLLVTWFISWCIILATGQQCPSHQHASMKLTITSERNSTGHWIAKVRENSNFVCDRLFSITNDKLTEHRKREYSSSNSSTFTPPHFYEYCFIFILSVSSYFFPLFLSLLLILFFYLYTSLPSYPNSSPTFAPPWLSYSFVLLFLHPPPLPPYCSVFNSKGTWLAQFQLQICDFLEQSETFPLLWGMMKLVLIITLHYFINGFINIV